MDATKVNFILRISKPILKVRNIENSAPIWYTNVCGPKIVREYTTPAGSGAGKGGGSGGAVRESGGSLGRLAAAHEEEYFFYKQRQQLEEMRKKMEKEGPKPPSVSNEDNK